MQFVSVMVLARLLTPEDIGIYTIGLAIIGIAHMIRDFGIGKYIVQEKRLTREKVATALGLTITLAWTLGLIVWLSAPYVAEFYGEPGIQQVVHVVSLNFLIIPLGAMSPALLKRSMSFGTLLKINLSSTFLSVVVGVTLAYLGYGYLSMAWASVANVSGSAAMAQYYLPKKYRVLPSLKNPKNIISFGWHVVGANLAKELNASALDLMVGKLLGFVTVGFLSRAQGFVKIYENIITKAVEPVITAHLAKTHRAGELIGSSYLTAVTYSTVIGWFVLGFMALMSSPLIRILYGDQWDAAVPFATLLCILTCIGISTNTARGLLVSTGNAKINFKLTILFVGMRIFLIFVLVKKGLYLLLLSFLALACCNLFVTHVVVFRLFAFDGVPFLRAAYRNMAIVLFSLALPGCFYLDNHENGLSPISELLIAGLVAFASWVLLVFIFKHPLREELRGIWLVIERRFGKGLH